MFAPGAAPYLAFGGAALVAFGLAWWFTGGAFFLPVVASLIVLVGGWGFFVVFFRDPERVPGAGVVSAADGRVREVVSVGDRVTISVFMNVSDVHVNRLPLDGQFARIDSSGRGHRPAFAADAAKNVSRTYELSTSVGPVELVQVTGIFARRLVSFVKVGQTHLKGERLGMIVFGSRVDLTLPADRVRVTVRAGQRVRAGTSTVAELRA